MKQDLTEKQFIEFLPSCLVSFKSDDDEGEKDGGDNKLTCGFVWLVTVDSKGMQDIDRMYAPGVPLACHQRIFPIYVLQLAQAWQVEIQQIIRRREEMMWSRSLSLLMTAKLPRRPPAKREARNLPLNGEPEFSRDNLTAYWSKCWEAAEASTMLRRASSRRLMYCLAITKTARISSTHQIVAVRMSTTVPPCLRNSLATE
jgi:hypothetical protein